MKTPHFIKRFGGRILLATGIVGGVLMLPMQSSVAIPYNAAGTQNGNTWAVYQGLPLTSVNSVAPLVMLTMSRDHQLHYKAYNDYSDLVGSTQGSPPDGQLDTTYTHHFDYYGYFDPYKCYDYLAASNRFEPISVNTDKYCAGNWSGNFLNWMATTRMDAVRKLLYGGMRAAGGDTASLTVLERSFLPTDAHSYAKYYEGSDLNRLTPFSQTPGHTSPGVIGSTEYVARRVTAMSRSSTTITATTSGNHGYSIGQYVLVNRGGCPTNFGGIFQITAVPSSTQFRFTTTSSGSCSSPGTSASSQMVVRLDISASTPTNIGNWLQLTKGSASIKAEITNLLTPANASAGAVRGADNVSQIWLATSQTVYAQISVDTSQPLPSDPSPSTDVSIRNLTNYGVTFCNTTLGTGSSQANTNPPIFRATRGNFMLWGANERWQCHWHEETNDSNSNIPSISGIYAWNRNPVRTVHHLDAQGSVDGAFTVRVRACVPGLEGTERCQGYPSGNKKPVGLLQVYGETGRIKFGLITPSYQKNISGGVVRKNIAAMDDEINVDTNGTFKPTKGIIYNLNRLKVYGYNYGDGTYSNSASSEACTFQLTGLVPSGGSNSGGQPQSEGNCASWGNPIGEAYVESLRYFAGRTPDSRFQPGSNPKDATLAVSDHDSASIGLTVVNSWSDPLDKSNYCASLNVLAFNASVSSYDDDQANLLSELAGAPDVAAWTKRIGDEELITGTQRFVGNNGSTNDGYCTAKTISNLSTAKGLCPEAASLKGSYLMSGAAYFSHTNRIRTPASITGATIPDSDSRSLKVDTYGIQLATNTPKITIPIPAKPGKFVSILPTYRLNVGSSFGGGALVDFRVISQDREAGTGRFYVNWEDSAQGGDYDQDMWGLIDYKVSDDGSQITVTTAAISASSVNPQGFGYIISGTTKDGPHFHSGIYNFNFTDSTGVTGCSNCNAGNPATSVTYTISASGSTVESLEDPLFYAAKYGGFDDADKSGKPDSTDKWDIKKADGSDGSDGIPDNYFLVSNPAALEQSLQRAFSAILAKTSSGTAAAVVANAREGQGAIYQALYEPRRIDDNGREVFWLGTVHGLWVDDKGYLREDGNGNAKLDYQDAAQTIPNYSADPVVEIFFDAGDRVTRFRRYSGVPAGTNFTIRPLSDLRTIWNARRQLSALSSATLASQRPYSSSAGTGRYIFTAIDLDLDGKIDGVSGKENEAIDFTAANFGSGKFGILNVKAQADAANLVNFTRGIEISGLRSRTIDYDGDGTAEVIRLGDIVNSTPTVVGTPAEAFDLIYNDASYAVFRNQYRDRRNVVYVGANDGMIHAFNAGFYDSAAKQFKTTPTVGTGTAHPLGSELWAYVPYNLLPHLPWLSDPDYNHVWYMDGKPRVFDARVFTPDADHPHGWGTLMVVGMRFGGEKITMTSPNPKPTDTTKDGFSAFTPSVGATITTRSAYVVMDITNPEKPPRLLAELSGAGPTDNNLGFTTSFPTVISMSSKDVKAPTAVTSNPKDPVNTTADLADKWYLVFGSGPTDRTKATTANNVSAKLYIYDLAQTSGGGFVTGFAPKELEAVPASPTVPGNFTGDPVTVDWDLDFKADALYVGTSGGTSAAPKGKLFKLRLDKNLGLTSDDRSPGQWQGPFVLTDAGNPILSTPTVTFDEQGNRWVFSGTGRFLSAADDPYNDKKSAQVQTLFGLIDFKKDPPTTGSVQYPFSGLINVTNAKVSIEGKVTGMGGVLTAPNDNELGLATKIAEGTATKGWVLQLPVPAAIAERNVTQASLLGEILFSTTFLPSIDSCGGEGSSQLYGLYYKTGAAKAGVPVFGTRTITTPTTMVESIREISIGAGLAASPSLHLGGARDQRGLTVFAQTSTGAIERRDGSVSPSARSGEIDWRDVYK